MQEVLQICLLLRLLLQAAEEAEPSGGLF